ncbi:MAG TPA: hypothetical protein VEO56_04215 [Bacteroidota bacterium]|nr:hypothetical protein [Bacteroidota bacterium]
MTTIVVLIFLMIGLIVLSKQSQKMGVREYLIIFLVTVAQVALVILYLFTVERPPIS